MNNKIIQLQLEASSALEGFDTRGLAAYYCAPMSESPVPAHVDTRKIFLQQGTVSGHVSLDRLARFQEYLANSTGSIQVELGFHTDESGQQLIIGNLQAKVQVICQRCLGPLALELADDIKLVLLRDETDAERLDSNLDPWICLDNKLDIARLVEEQLILCLPTVSYHQAGDCYEKFKLAAFSDDAISQTKMTPEENPFSILKSLKENDGIT